MARNEREVVPRENTLLLSLLLRAFGSVPSGPEIEKWIRYFNDFKSSRLLGLMSREAEITMRGFIDNSSHPVDLNYLPSYELAEPISDFDKTVKTRSPVEKASSRLIAGSPVVRVCDRKGNYICEMQDVIVVPNDQPDSFKKIHYWTGTEAVSVSEAMFSASPFVLMKDGVLIGQDDYSDHKKLIEFYLDAIGVIAKPRQFSFVTPGDWPRCDNMFSVFSQTPEEWIDSFVDFRNSFEVKLVDSKHQSYVEAIKVTGKRLGYGDRSDDLLRRQMSPNLSIHLDGNFYQSTMDYTVGNLLSHIYNQIKEETETQVRGMLGVINHLSRKGGDIPPALILDAYASWAMSVVALFNTQINQRIRDKLKIEPSRLRDMTYHRRRDFRREEL
ncbi:hypothetical protein KBB48_03425 [Candidatus Shapirobacteria bacterium]|nr:hypothetical protein [Candidatus Shapirobacteria bacterium]